MIDDLGPAVLDAVGGAVLAWLGATAPYVVMVAIGGAGLLTEQRRRHRTSEHRSTKKGGATVGALDPCYARSGNNPCRTKPVPNQQSGEQELIRCRDCTGTYYTGFLVSWSAADRRAARVETAVDTAVVAVTHRLTFAGKFAILAIVAAVLYVVGLVQGWW